MNDNDIRKLAARRTIYSLPGNPSPWPRRLRRIVYVLLIFAAAALLYTFAAEASGNPPPRPTTKPWPPTPPSRYYCHKADPSPPSYCLAYWSNSRRPTGR